MFADGSLIAVRCKISRGGFSSERVFHITLAGGAERVGAAPVEYFFDEKAKSLPAGQPPRGEVIAGFVAGRVVSNEGETSYLISVPSGEVLEVEAGEITVHPRESRAHVFVQP